MKIGPSVLLLSPAVVAELVLFTDALEDFVAFTGRLSRESNGGSGSGCGPGCGGGMGGPPLPLVVGHPHSSSSSSSSRRVAGSGGASGSGVGFELGERDVRCGARSRPQTLDVSVHANLEFMQPTLVLLHADRPRRLLPSAFALPSAAQRSSAHSGIGTGVGAAGSPHASLGAPAGSGFGGVGLGASARAARGSDADGDWQSIFAQLGAALVRDFPQLERCPTPTPTRTTPSSNASLSGPDTLTADSGAASIEANTQTQINFKQLQRRITEHLSVLVPFDQLRRALH